LNTNSLVRFLLLLLSLLFFLAIHLVLLEHLNSLSL
jgi:hypothetical protein